MSTIMTPKARPVRKLLADADTAAEEKFLAIHKVEVDAFVRLLGRGTVALLLEKDRCCNYADNYLLATVLVYFKRAKLGLEEYTQDNFWRCLYLAHDQEEDEEELKWELLAWALGDSWRTRITSFLAAKDAIWKRMGFRSAVAKRQCDQIMALSGCCGVWTRHRHQSHSGAVRRVGEDQYIPRGPDHFTASFSTLCTKCEGHKEKGGSKEEESEDVFIVIDSLDTLDEEEDSAEESEDDTMEVLSDFDSGLESSEEDYRDFEFFARD